MVLADPSYVFMRVRAHVHVSNVCMLMCVFMHVHVCVHTWLEFACVRALREICVLYPLEQESVESV
jgi:hypothetical protein